MPSLIDILIRASWAGSRATQQAKKDLGNIEEGARKGERGISDLQKQAAAATIVIGALNVAADRAFDVLERGTGLELTRQRFDRLALSIGSTGDILREDLGQATQGLLSNAQQMQLATDLVGLGLAKNQDQVLRLSRVVTELDQDIGELTLALANQTTRRFDQLGVSIFGFQERLEALEAQGLSTEEAFTEAFLQQAEAQIDRVGGVAGTRAGDLRTFNAEIENIKDSAELAVVSLADFTGGFDRLENIAETLGQIADGIEKVRQLTDGLDFNIGLGPQSALEDPLGAALSRIFPFGTDAIARRIIETEDFDNALENLKDTVSDIAGFAGIEIFDNLDEQIAQAELADIALKNLSNTTAELTENTRELNKISASGPDRTASGRDEEITQLIEDTNQERAELFEDFQEDVTAITQEGAAERRELELRYEQERSDIVADYGRLRAEEEEDWLRRRARQEEELRDNIQELRESAGESEVEAVQERNDRLADLESDHLRRMQEIIENADLQLSRAASRLDARAVANILSDRDAALRKEEQSFQDQRQAIEETLQEQLVSIRENLEERITDLQEFHDKRREQEAEDRQVRLRRLEEAHQRELQELEQNYRDRQQQLKRQVAEELRIREQQYVEERSQLTSNWQDRMELEAQWQAAILEQEEAWWQARANIISGATAGSGLSGRGDAGGGAASAAGGSTGERPDRDELRRTAIAQATAAGWTENMIFDMLRDFRGLSDAEIARFIENTFGYDVPGYLHGIDRVPNTGLALLHEGEAVLDREEATRYRAGQSGMNVEFNIYQQPGQSADDVARAVRREMTSFYRGIAA